MKKIILLLLIFPITSIGQNFKNQFQSKFNNEDYNAKEVKEILEKWEQNNKNDVEYFIAAFNFYFRESQQELLQLSKEEPTKNQDALVLTDSLGNKSGYLYSKVNSNDSLFRISQKTIDEAIKLFPNRLDLRFGKIHTLGKVEGFKEFTSEIIKTIEYSNKIKHKWLWSNDKILDDPENFFIDAIQGYQNTLFQAESDENLKKVAKRMYDTFPNDLYVISSYGVTFLIENKNNEALELYLKAEKINPNDTIVLSNIGLIYERLSDKKNAIKYYQKIEKVGDERAKEMARKKIIELK
jgi:tetratricopeptide (TPR) repeat protein